MRKQYYANVEVSCVEYFEKNLEERKDLVTVITKDDVPRTSEDGTQYIQYILEAEENIIDSAWELL
jgi:hypothetical protein